MKLKPISIPDWLGYCIVAPILIAAAPIIAGGFALGSLAWLKRQVVGPGEAWDRWFAWYPVRVDFGDTRWLEIVERRSHGVICDTHYRAHPSSQEVG